ncbi:MAG: diaminopimelate decarboxylase [Candidatus Midichloriaceae bacterium]|jgi:diaminopimelate decarboxylase
MQNIDYFQSKKGVFDQIISQFGTPVFVTDKQVLKEKVLNIKNSFSEKCKLFYAMKANFNPSIINALKEFGLDGVETISPYEIQLAKKLGFKGDQILFTGNNSAEYELDFAKEEGVIVNIGSLNELRYFGNKYRKSELSIRINPGFGDGEFQEVITGGDESKFGIIHSKLDEVLQIINECELKVIGLHCHLGSGLYKTDQFEKMIILIFDLTKHFQSIQFVDLGGGFGVRYYPDSTPVDLNLFSEIVEKYYMQYDLLKKNDVKIIFEPGKYLVAESTFLLTKVTNVLSNKNIKIVGVDTGMNHIGRPALYDSYHHAINISKPVGESENVQIVGNICESTDIINKEIRIANPEVGDVLAILTAGAYCASMSNLYNLRPYATEVMLDMDKFSIIRKRMGFKETFNAMGYTEK